MKPALGNPDRSNHSPRYRIEKVASRLFYEQGYDQTGINQILDCADSHKASLYRHFSSKEELARILISEEADRFISFLQTALRHHSQWNSFVDFWIFLLKRSMRSSFSRGCPFLRYAQTGPGNSSWAQEIRSTFERAGEVLTRYFKEIEAEDDKDFDSIAGQCLSVYEGATQLAVITGEESYIDGMGDALKKLLK